MTRVLSGIVFAVVALYALNDCQGVRVHLSVTRTAQPGLSLPVGPDRPMAVRRAAP